MTFNSSKVLVNPSALNYVPSCVKNFSLIGNAENRSSNIKPVTTNNKKQASRNYLRTHPRRSERRAESDLEIAR